MHIICMYIGVYLGVPVYVWVYPCTCMHVYWCTWVCVHSTSSMCVRLRVAAFGIRLVQSEHGNGRFGVVLVMDLIHRRFRNWPIGWSGDSYRFAQWRPDGDSVSKPCHFMWVLVYWSISISTFYLNISCPCIYYSALFCSCRSLLLHYNALILFYWYIVTLLPTVLSIRSIILGRWVLVLILLISNNQMRI